jgi:hypothetical protein
MAIIAENIRVTADPIAESQVPGLHYTTALAKARRALNRC